MSYSINYSDGKENYQKISISEDDSKEALKNDYEELIRRYNSEIVQIDRVPSCAGEALHLTVTIKAPSHFLSSESDTNPKPCNEMSFDIVCYPGYPLTKVISKYPQNKYLASPNTFPSGVCCIDNWIPFKSSLISVMDKLLHDYIHDPSVTRYDSMANSSMKPWHMKGVEEGKFPTVNPKILYSAYVPPLPPQELSRKNNDCIPLPKRK